jgi:hypothetical protein
MDLEETRVEATEFDFEKYQTPARISFISVTVPICECAKCRAAVIGPIHCGIETFNAAIG